MESDCATLRIFEYVECLSLCACVELEVATQTGRLPFRGMQLSAKRGSLQTVRLLHGSLECCARGALASHAKLTMLYDTHRVMTFVRCSKARSGLLAYSGGPPSRWLTGGISEFAPYPQPESAILPRGGANIVTTPFALTPHLSCAVGCGALWAHARRARAPPRSASQIVEPRCLSRVCDVFLALRRRGVDCPWREQGPGRHSERLAAAPPRRSGGEGRAASRARRARAAPRQSGEAGPRTAGALRRRARHGGVAATSWSASARPRGRGAAWGGARASPTPRRSVLCAAQAGGSYPRKSQESLHDIGGSLAPTSGPHTQPRGDHNASGNLPPPMRRQPRLVRCICPPFEIESAVRFTSGQAIWLTPPKTTPLRSSVGATPLVAHLRGGRRREWQHRKIHWHGGPKRILRARVAVGRSGRIGIAARGNLFRPLCYGQAEGRARLTRMGFSSCLHEAQSKAGGLDLALTTTFRCIGCRRVHWGGKGPGPIDFRCIAPFGADDQNRFSPPLLFRLAAFSIRNLMPCVKTCAWRPMPCLFPGRTKIPTLLRNPKSTQTFWC